MRRAAGFSLIEILVAILIAGIVAAIAIPVVKGQRDRAKDTQTRQAVELALRTARHYYALRETYSGLNTQLSTYEPTLTVGGAEMWPNAPDPETYRPGGSLVDPRKIRLVVFAGGQCVEMLAVGKGRRSYGVMDCREPLDYLYGGTTNVHFEPGTYYGDSVHTNGVSAAESEIMLEQDAAYDND